jgi:hypothetical protein
MCLAKAFFRKACRECLGLVVAYAIKALTHEKNVNKKDFVQSTDYRACKYKTARYQ